jgi:hypothetical protein
MFSNTDLIQIKKRGTHLEAISQQIENFKKGFPFANLIRPAIPGDGLKQFSADDLKGLISLYDRHSGERKIIKFVPASGAASRMFQIIYNYTDAAKNPKMEPDELLKDKGFNSVYNFISRIKDFAFYDDLKDILAKNGFGIEDLLSRKEYPIIIDYLLNEKGLDYGKQPKGLLKFHRYSDHCRIPLEEHIAEAATYGTSKNKIASIHFTVSPEHLNRFTEQVSKVKSRYERLFGITLHITFSVQKSSTDTIAVDLDNNPFRENGNLIFRPGGHGALIENLNDLDGDIIFIKNIDNVVPDRLKAPTTEYKKAIGGHLLKLQTTTFNYLNKLEQESSSGGLDQIADFAKEELNINLPDGFQQFSPTKKREFLIHYLNRPIRVCGMVKNEGEPGGGPFWVKNSKGETSLQIVESSQVDMNNPEQSVILKSSTHFNPVDLVCGTKDYKNNRFDLHRFIDPETGFISVKSKDGKNLKAQELPGLWNGAMADWITIFVEVPISTFNPVKIVNDLLRPQHQPEDKG